MHPRHGSHGDYRAYAGFSSIMPHYILSLLYFLKSMIPNPTLFFGFHTLLQAATFSLNFCQTVGARDPPLRGPGGGGGDHLLPTGHPTGPQFELIMLI